MDVSQYVSVGPIMCDGTERSVLECIAPEEVVHVSGFSSLPSITCTGMSIMFPTSSVPILHPPIKNKSM